MTGALNVPVDDLVPAATDVPPKLKPTVVSVPEPRLVRFPLSVAEVTVTALAAPVATVGGVRTQALVVNDTELPDPETAALLTAAAVKL